MGLITLDQEVLPKFSAERGLADADASALAEDPAVLEAVGARPHAGGTLAPCPAG